MQNLSFEEILASDRKKKEKAREIADKIRVAGNYKWVGIYDVTEREISLVSCAGRPEPAFTTFPRDKGLNGRAVSQRKTVVVNDTEKDEDYLLTFTNTLSEIIVPVFDKAKTTVLGTIDAEGEVKNAFSEKDALFLENCAEAIQSLWTPVTK